MVLRRCQQLLRDEGLAVDAMHDVFVQLLQHQQRLNAVAPSSLLYRIATHVCLNQLRTHKQTYRPENEVEKNELLEHIAATDNVESHTVTENLLNYIFRRHPESTRTIAVLHLVDGWTLEDVAKETGLSVSGVRKRLRTLRLKAKTLEDRS